MRNVQSHLLGDKMDEAVTHYINTHQPSDHVHIDTDGMPITVQDDGSRITVMHQQTYSSHLCRQVSVSEPVGEGPWGEELLDPEGRIAAIVAHLSQNPRTSHHHPHHKVPSSRNEVDASVILDSSIRFNGPPMEQQSVSLAGLPPMQTLPPLQEMKRCQDTDWFTDKNKKNDSQLGQLTDSDGPVLELSSGSPALSRQHNRKSLPHKKRISRKLKRNGGSTPQQDLVVINNIEPVVAPVVEEEQILPDNFVTVQQPSHHISHEVRPIFICQICGEFYGEEQLKFFHHLKQHYEPHTAIIIDNPVSDLVMDKMSNSCIVDNVATLPDSIVELSLESSVPKTMYQPIDKHHPMPLTYNNIKVHYSMASMVKETASVEPEKSDLYESLDKMELYNCGKCSKTFRKQKQCEAHMREAHPVNTKLEDMGEFSEPEDLMAGIHVCVGEYEQPLLPHLTVDNGHVHQDHTRHWYSNRNGSHDPCDGRNVCNPAAYCATCDREPVSTHTHPTQAHPHTTHAHSTHAQSSHNTSDRSHSTHIDTSLASQSLVSDVPRGHVTEHAHAHAHAHTHTRHVSETHTHVTPSETQPLKVLKEEVLQRIFECEVPPPSYNNMMHEHDDNSQENSHDHNLHDHNPHHHNSHEHNPHEHSPHEHSPHEHSPHEHNTHERNPHGRNPHGRHPHECNPHENASRNDDRDEEIQEQKHTVQENIQDGIPTTDGKHKRLECSECGRVFAHRNSLMYHALSHAARQHDCALCSKSFFTAAALKIHKRVHNGDKPYKCELCGRDFRQWSDLKYHTISLHSNEKRFKCDFCGKEFARKYSLNVHRRIHTGERNYKCDYCTKSFSASSYRQMHMRTHTDVRPYKCEQCEKSFRSAFDLRRHLLVHDKLRNRFDELKPKPKEKKIKPEKEEKEEPPIEKKKATHITTFFKKPIKKKSPTNKKGAPNITVQNKDGQFTTNELEKPQFTKFKVICSDQHSYKNQPYKDSDRDGFAVLRPLLRDERYRENTDGKLQIFTHVEKGKEYSSIVPNSQVLGDIRHLERDAREGMNGEVIENGFLEELTAMYNLPT